jgi:8-oxo-dGTP diphosphatase
MCATLLGMTKRYLSTGEAADQLGIKSRTLRQWAHDGLVKPVFRTPRRGDMRWDMDELHGQLRNQPTPTPTTGTPVTDAGPRPIVAAIVISDLGLLLTKRNDGIPPYGFCTGKIEPGEIPHRAAEREVLEETGMRVRAGVTIAERIHPKTQTHMSYVACYPTDGTDVAVTDADELAEVMWVSLADALALMQPPFTMYEPVRAYLARREGKMHGRGEAEAL